MNVLNGISGASGYGSGIAAVKRSMALEIPKYSVDDSVSEEKRFRDAQASCEKHLNELMNDSVALSNDAAEIFKAYLVILRDDAFFKKALKRVDSEKLNIEHLISDECKKVVAKFAAFDDPYLRERAVDIENVCTDLICTMLGIKENFVIPASRDVIVVAEDLTPAETMKMDKSRLRGFVTEKGGATSHTVILAKALNIPAIIGVQGALNAVSDGDFLLLDAFKGTVAIDPDEQYKAAFQSLSDSQLEKQKMYEQDAGQPAITLDGRGVSVNVNTGDTDSINAFDGDKCDGVGLLRTEFIYLDCGDYPDEERQYAVYRDLAERAGGKEVIIRTLDIGGDKQASYMDLPKEENPFLGFRAIRLCLDRRDVFHTQLRAILRASIHGDVKIMFPMIVNLEELREAKACVEKAKQSLKQDGIAFREDTPVGIMVETPAAVFISDRLAKEAAFFSVGSNDLIQYITATDRMNERVQYLYDSCNLSVLGAMRMIAQNAAAAGIPWGICGEVASEDILIPVWVALGVSELSVAPSLVGRVKHLIRRLDSAKLLPEIENVLAMRSIDEVKVALSGILKRIDG